MATTISTKNTNRPAPKWFRITKTIVNTLTAGSILTGTMQRFGVSDSDALLIIAWSMVILEMLGKILANGEDYAKIK